MPCAGVTQRYLDCGLHEVATGDKDSVADQKARVFIAEQLADKDLSDFVMVGHPDPFQMGVEPGNVKKSLEAHEA